MFSRSTVVVLVVTTISLSLSLSLSLCLFLSLRLFRFFLLRFVLSRRVSFRLALSRAVSIDDPPEVEGARR